MNENKRLHQRYKCKLQIKYEIFSSPKLQQPDASWEGETYLLDISEGGILFTSESPIPFSSFLEIEIKIPNKEFPIYLTGRVVRLEEIKENQEYEIGFFFKNIFEKDKELLTNYLNELEKQ